MLIQIFNPINGNEASYKAVERLKKALDSGSISYCSEHEKHSVKPDIIAVFGGDGTVLKAARYATETGAAIFAVNTGTLGFLTGAEPDEIESAADAIKTGNYFVSERTTLCIRSGGDEYFALNDAVIERDKYVKDLSIIGKLRLSIDGTTVYDLRADGVIISTPTGSTAYSLSAGGVIMTPDMNAFIATPICSHSLTVKPIIYPDKKSATIDVLSGSSPCVLCVDGRSVKSLSINDSVTVSRGEKTLRIIDIKRNFFEKIKNRLGE